VPWYIHLALRQLFPTGRKFPFFTVISTLGVTLGVALLIIVMGVMGGFAYETRHKIVDTEGDVQIKARGWISDYPSVIKKVEAVPGVAGATPYASDRVMIMFGDKAEYPELRGIDLNSVDRVTPLDKYLVIGSLDDMDDDSIILSAQLAASIGASVGNTIEVYSPLIIRKMGQDEVFLPRQVRVVGQRDGHRLPVDGAEGSRPPRRVPAQDELGPGAVRAHRVERPGFLGRAAREPGQPFDAGVAPDPRR